MTPEHQRLVDAASGIAEWRKWGPYLSERQWGTVREDAGASGDAWNDFPHDHARSRAYRWGEDGLAGICDDRQRLCFALALWNGVDPILKERLFGLTNSEGNHGEDVKEYYYYLDCTPAHTYMRYLYKYPQSAFPYHQLINDNKSRSRGEPEYELIDTGIFADNKYFDIIVEYAKSAPEDIVIFITVCNRAAVAAAVHLLPTLWFRNTWSWTIEQLQPNLSSAQGPGGASVIAAIHHELGDYYLYCDAAVPLLFTANETNNARLFGRPNRSPYVKDGINDFVVAGRDNAVNPAMTGTKAAAHYRLTLPPGGTETVRLRLTNLSPSALRAAAGRGGVKPLAVMSDQTLTARREEADAFFATVIPRRVDADRQRVMRQALAGMLWTKQFYLFDVGAWLLEHGVDALSGSGNRNVRNPDWSALDAGDVLSMPDKWEYPWFAAWDQAFHAVALAVVDPAFAKQQLSLMICDRYMHPSGQIPAYEWNFSDVNPPVHAWATRFVYLADRQMNGGSGDLDFYKRTFMALIANLTWWLNRKDAAGNTVISCGYLGLDNLGVLDRSAALPAGGAIEQSDGLAWMAFHAAAMLDIAIDLASVDGVYVDWVHRCQDAFLRIAASMDAIGRPNGPMWDDEDGFFYTIVRFHNGNAERLRVRSAAGLLPLCAVVVYPQPAEGDALAALAERARGFLKRYRAAATLIAPGAVPGVAGRRMLALVNEEKLRRILARLLDPEEFLSDYGIRSVSRAHNDAPFVMTVGGVSHRIEYEPAESLTAAFGGNSNWRGPVWLPINVLIIDALLTHYSYYGDNFTVDCPTGSGQAMTLFAVAAEIAARLVRLFCLDATTGRRAANASIEPLAGDPHWRDHILFYEYFHGDTGAGLGASHQTGWTGTIAKLIQFFATTSAEEALEKGLRLSAAPAR